MTGGPGPLEIKSSEPAGDVDHFANKVEAFDVAGLHGFGGEVGGVDSAEGDFGFGVSFRAGDGEGAGMEVAVDGGPIGFGKLG